MRVVSANEMQTIETRAYEEYGLHAKLIIENVGLRSAGYINHHYLREGDYDQVVIVLGKGNNASDGAAIGRHLRRFGHRVYAFLLFNEQECNNDLKEQLNLASRYGVRTENITHSDELTSFLTQTGQRTLIIDAIFGMGVRLPLSQFIFDVVKSLNKYTQDIISIDMPSGVRGDDGEMQGNAIKARETLAIILPKLGHYVGDGISMTGKLTIIDGGLPNELLKGGKVSLLTSTFMAKILKRRDQFAHKNNFGHALIIGGSKGLTGAPLMAAMASLKVGAGMATAMTWENCYSELVSRVLPEIITDFIPQSEVELKRRLKYLERFDCVVIGPGMGRSKKTRENVLTLLKYFKGPVVIDADAINVLDFKDDRETLLGRKAPTLFTPHLGEFSRLLNVPKESLIRAPIKHLKQFVEGSGCSVVLKGPSTFMAFPSGHLFIQYLPNSGMAQGGSGDILAGILGGLISQQGYEAGHQHGHTKELSKIYQTTCVGVYAHSVAGKIAADKLGERAMMATSILDHLSKTFFDLDDNKKLYQYQLHDFDT